MYVGLELLQVGWLTALQAALTKLASERSVYLDALQNVPHTPRLSSVVYADNADHRYVVLRSLGATLATRMAEFGSLTEANTIAIGRTVVCLHHSRISTNSFDIALCA